MAPTPLKYEGANYLRQRMVLATISGRPIIVSNIRADDENPGLRDYEASFLRLLDKICDGCVIKINETGTVLRYTPGQIIGGDSLVHACPPTRSIAYYVEALVLLAPFAKRPLSIKLKGITNDGADIACDTLRTVALPLLQRHFGLGESMVFKILKRGARPEGGGEVIFTCPIIQAVQPVEILNEGKVKRVRGVAFTAKVSPQFAARMVDAARGVLNDFLPDVWIYTDHGKGDTCGNSPGYGISLVAETITQCLKSADACADLEGTDEKALGSPEEVGAAAAKRLLAEIELNGVVDTAHQPMAIFFLAMSEETKPARIRLSRLSPAAVALLRHLRDFLGVSFKIREDNGGSVTLSCMGIGLKNIARRTF